MGRWQCLLAEYISRPAHSQRIADDLPTADGIQRPIPHLVEHPQRLIPTIALAQVRQSLTQTGRQCRAPLRSPELSGYRFDLRGELFEIVGFGDEGRDVQALELFTLGRADAAGPEQ
ncbi:hypothetical protein D3C87_1766320 [compost metagenome]